jgi:hypothetical protein
VPVRCFRYDGSYAVGHSQSLTDCRFAGKQEAAVIFIGVSYDCCAEDERNDQNE